MFSFKPVKYLNMQTEPNHPNNANFDDKTLSRPQDIAKALLRVLNKQWASLIEVIFFSRLALTLRLTTDGAARNTL